MEKMSVKHSESRNLKEKMIVFMKNKVNCTLISVSLGLRHVWLSLEKLIKYYFFFPQKRK